MSWAILTPDDVLVQFTPAEAGAIRNLVGGSGSGTGSGPPFNDITITVIHVIDEVRDYIRAGGYPLDDDPRTIPIGFFNDAIAMVRWRLLISLPVLRGMQTAERKAAFDEAIKKLLRVADQQFAVEPPDDSGSSRTGNWNSECKLIMRTHPVPQPSAQFPEKQGDWANLTGPSFPPLVVGETPTGLINGVNEDFTTASGFTRLFVYLNGVRMKETVDYNITGSNAFHFLYAPTTGDSLLVDYTP